MTSKIEDARATLVWLADHYDGWTPNSSEAIRLLLASEAAAIQELDAERKKAAEAVMLPDHQIKLMVERFLSWRLPADFNPDCGISFKAAFNEHTVHPMRHEPVGTNLLNWDQAAAMVRHMLEGVPINERLVIELAAAEDEVDDRKLESADLNERAGTLLASLAKELGPSSDWTAKLAELYGWSGSAWVAGESDDDHRPALYSFLCSLIGYLMAGADAASIVSRQKGDGGARG